MAIQFKASPCFAFLKESLIIEGIFRNPTEDEIKATEGFLELKGINLDALNALQAIYAPNKPPRTSPGMDVSVGNYLPPPGGVRIGFALIDLLDKANLPEADPWKIHIEFEALHPYMDGNGRTGRALWAWGMKVGGEDPFEISFLHRFYYQTLMNIGNNLL